MTNTLPSQPSHPESQSGNSSSSESDTLSDAPNYNPENEMSELKTSRLDRRLSIAKTSLNLGRRWAGNSFSGLFMNKEQKALRNQEFMKEQAAYLADELGKLKGSVVKIGQMLALYGEHFLHPEITLALHRLNDSTASLSWSVVENALRDQLGDRLKELDVAKTPIGTASLAQVHRATIKATGQQVVMKVQYPGVADAIDSDLSLFKHLLKVTNAVPQTKALDEWFNEISDLLKVEVNYHLEAQTTMRFYNRLKDDPRYIVPQVIEEYSNDRVLCLSYEEGIPVTNVNLQTLSQERRDALGKAAIDIMLNEIFVWGEMQTDPNFGNYLIRLADDQNTNQQDKLILLDFGAMRQFDDNLLKIARGLMLAGFHYNKQEMIDAMQGYEFFDTMSEDVKSSMADVFLLATEPFRAPILLNETANDLVDKEGFYHWAESNLHKRLMESSGSAMQSREFSLPPKEFMFISRKFIGAYTFLTVLDARTNTYDTIRQFVPINVTTTDLKKTDMPQPNITKTDINTNTNTGN